MRCLYAFIIFLSGLFIFNSCLEDPDMPHLINANVPEIKLDTIYDIKANSLRIKASIIKQNGSPVSQSGFRWRDELGKGDSIFVPVINSVKSGVLLHLDTIIDHLSENTKYTFEAFARNEMGEGVSDTIIKPTMTGLGVVVTIKPDSVNIKGTSVVSGGKIINAGEGKIDERGVYLSIEKDMLKIDSIYVSTIEADSFIFKLEDLKPSTQYYIQAYVKNKYGIFKGNIESFKTLDGKPVMGQFSIIETGFINATFTAEILDGGDTQITEQGICWSEYPLPTISSDTMRFDPNTESFKGEIKDLRSFTTYYARAYAINSFGVQYSNQEKFVTENNLPEIQTIDEGPSFSDGSALVKGQLIKSGMNPIDAIGFCWSISPNPTVMNDTYIVEDAKGIYSAWIGKLKANTTYYFKAFVRSSSGFIGYGEELSFTTPDELFTLAAPFTEKVRMPNSSAFFSIGYIGYLLGGDLGSEYTDELISYNWTSNRWEKLLPFPGGKMKWQATATTDNSVYVFGGIDRNKNMTNALYRYLPSSNEWEKVTVSSGAIPDSLRSAIGCSIDNIAYFIGGCRDTVTNEVWAFDMDTRVWTKKANFPVKQQAGIVVDINGIIYAGLGLSDVLGTSSHKRMWKSEDKMNTWKEVAVFPGSKARGAIVSEDNYIYVIDSTGRLYIYDPYKNEWIQKSQLPPNNRGDSQHCMYVFGKSIYIGLGTSKETLYKYNPLWDN